MRRSITTIALFSTLAVVFLACPPSEVEDPTCTPTNGGVEACSDGIDNDCDGQIDLRDSDCCTPTNGGIEACDGVDNNCNGQIDEGCSSGDCTEGTTRACGGTPASNVCVETCVGGHWGACSPNPPNRGVEICIDGIDNDCDGTVDENCECSAGDTNPCGGSAPSTICVETCSEDGQWQACAPNPPNTGVEICDGLDNDCDGFTDEDLDCSCTAGETEWCGGTPERHACQRECDGGVWGPCEVVSGDGVERCGDAQDNDCDSEIDEPEPCTSPCGEGMASCEGTTRGECIVPGAPCRPGEEETEPCEGEDRGICDPGEHTRSCDRTCNWSAWGSCTGVVGPRAEECNGLDDNCNGTVDDGASGSDSYGDNSSCYGAYWLGEDPDTTIYAMLDGDDDWFSLTAIDNISVFGRETIVVEVDSYATMDLGIELYSLACASEPIREQDVDGFGPERLEWPEETCMSGCDDDGEYYIRVRNWFGESGCYEIHVNGLN